jgi:hypothetical protein
MPSPRLSYEGTRPQNIDNYALGIAANRALSSRQIPDKSHIMVRSLSLCFHLPPSMGRPSEKVITVEQGVYPVPDIPVKDLLSAIPYVAPMPLAFSSASAEDFFLRPHCFQRSALRSSSYLCVIFPRRHFFLTFCLQVVGRLCHLVLLQGNNVSRSSH